MIGVRATRNRLNCSTLVRRLVGGAAWGMFGSILASGITLVAFMLVARLLEKEAYGKFVIVQSTLSMFGVFAGFGIGMAVTRYAAELRISDPERLGKIVTLAERTILAFGALSALTLVVLADWLAPRILNSSDLQQVLSVSALVIVFTALDGFQKSFLIGLESMRALALGSIAAAIIGLPVVILATHSLGLYGAALGLVALACVQAGFSRFQMAKELRRIGVSRSSSGCRDEWPVLLNFALPALISGALVGPVHWAAQAMLLRTHDGFAEVAVLGVAMQWFNLILFVPGSAGRVVLPILTDYVTRKDPASSRKIVQYSILANGLIAAPLALLVCLLSPCIMSMYGNGYENDTLSIVIAAIIAALVATQAPIGALIAANARMWMGVAMNLGWATAYLGSVYFLSGLGAVGVLSGLGIGYVMHAAWQACFVKRQFSASTKC